ncbi:MAG: hypothetical protein ACJA0X_002535 [Cyclobacteriaceae bacterium]|jgi:hypothetical protein
MLMGLLSQMLKKIFSINLITASFYQADAGLIQCIFLFVKHTHSIKQEVNEWIQMNNRSIGIIRELTVVKYRQTYVLTI